jgi:pyruvyltransferase
MFGLIPRENYVSIGSILHFSDKNSIVWGAGFISKDSYCKVPPKKILAVRGPLTRKKLIEQNIECPKIYGDPALLLPIFYHPKIKKKYEIGIVPHYVDQKNEIIKALQNKVK